jgi:hypothetical protein
MRYLTLWRCMTQPREVVRAVRALVSALDQTVHQLAEYRTELALVREERAKLVMITRLYANVKHGSGN